MTTQEIELCRIIVCFIGFTSLLLGILIACLGHTILGALDNIEKKLDDMEKRNDKLST